MLSGARDEEEEEEDGQTWCPQGECDTTSGNHVYESESEASGSDFNEVSVRWASRPVDPVKCVPSRRLHKDPCAIHDSRPQRTDGRTDGRKEGLSQRCGGCTIWGYEAHIAVAAYERRRLDRRGTPICYSW